MENINTERMTLYYQVDYTLTQVPDDAGYFHAQFRRNKPGERRGIHDGGWHQRQRTVRRHLYGLGRQQQRLVGRRRDQILYGWR
nr:DUF2961 domain-containing protein [Chitinophaga sp. XS-30]